MEGNTHYERYDFVSIGNYDTKNQEKAGMKTLKFLIEKEFKQMFRNKLIPMIILVYPAMVLLIFPWAINFEIKNIRIDVVDHCRNTYSRRLTNKVAASKYFILNDTPLDYQTAMQHLEVGETDMILEIPALFDREIVKNRSSAVGIAVNSVNGTQGLLGSNYITQIVSEFSASLREELIHTLPPDLRIRMMKTSNPDIATRYLFNPTLDYKNFMLPGFMVILLTLICGILPALNIVSEKESGTINQINVTPISKASFILAKLIPFWVIGMVILTIAVLLTYFIYGLWPTKGIMPVFISGIVFLFSISGMGIIISNYSDNMQQASFLVMFFILVVILLSGMFTPVSSMPKWAQLIAAGNPFTYLTKSLRMLYLNGSTLHDVKGNLMMLGLFAVILNGWAVISYRKRG